MTLRHEIACLSLLLGCAAASADPGYYVVTVYGEPGVRTLDYRYWAVKRPGAEVVSWPELGLGWTVNSRWYTELLASWIGSPSSATRLSSLNWQNDLLLTQGEYPFDLALHTLLVGVQDPWPGKPSRLLEFGPALQTDIGRTQLNLNAVFERPVSGAAAQSTQLKYQWQLRYRWRPELHLGAQGFGELGPWHDWSDGSAQSHRAGPALFGTLPSAAPSLAWQAAYLIGSTYARRGRMFTMRLKFDF